MNKELIKNLKELAALPSVSGNEILAVSYLKKNLENAGARLTVDTKYNLICQKGAHPEKLALVAHMDKLGFIVVGAGKDHLKVVGSHRLPLFPKGKISKVVCVNYKGFREYGSLFNLSSEENTLVVYLDNPKRFEIGDFVSYHSSFYQEKNTVVSSNLDNSMGVSVAIQVLKKIKEGTVIFSGLEEIGFQGVPVAIYKVRPERVIVLDTTYDVENPKGTRLYVGKGPSICLKDKVFGDRELIRNLLSLAKKKKIQHQIEAWEEANSDINTIHNMFEGIKCVFMGMPIKNPAKSLQTGSLKDMIGAQKLISEYFREVYKK